MSTDSEQRRLWRERQRRSRTVRGVFKETQRCGHCREYGHNVRTCPLIIHDQAVTNRDKRFSRQG